MRIVAFAYGVIAYVAFLTSFVYAIGFVGNVVVPKSIDSGPAGPTGTALFVDLVLLGLFAIQHNVMARPGFKSWWTKIVPQPVERSTFVLLASGLLLLLYWKWQPIAGVVWSIENPAGRFAIEVLCGLGWIVVLLSTFMINHFDLFGLRQVYFFLRGVPCPRLQFKNTALYQVVRHPIMLGFLIAFWATPAMSWGHLLFAVATTGFIFVGIFLEERDLAGAHGSDYADYRRGVPMILPIPGRRAS